MSEEKDKRTEMGGDDFESLFDYGDIKERDKNVVKEVISLIEARPGVPGNMIVAELKEKFEIVTVPMMDMKKSIWYQLTKDERLGFAMQGFRQTTDKDGNKIRIPHIGFSADLDYLDEFANRLAKKIQSLPTTEDK